MLKLSRRAAACAALASTVVVAIGVDAGVAGASVTKQARSKASAASAASGLAHAKADVKQYTTPAKVTEAGPVIKGGIAKLKGDKVWWIPQATQIPYFAAVLQGAQAAAKAAGLKLEVCNGNNTPTAISACINDAETEGGKGIVDDGEDIAQIQQAVNSAVSKKIPFVQSDLTQQKGNDKIAYAWNNSFLQSTLAADSIIAKSGGKANILVIRHTDSPSTEAFMNKGGLKELHTYCPDCKETIIQTNDAQLSQLTSQVSSALEKNPNINYIFAEFDLDVPSIESALQSLNKSIPISATTAELSSLQLIKENKYEFSDAGSDPAYMGWAAIDQVMRMMLGKPVNDKVPMMMRIFNSSNIGSLTLTDKAFVDGSWWGNANYQSMFKKLWGLS